MSTGAVLLWLGLVVWAHQGWDLNDQWNRWSWGWVGVAGLVVWGLGARGEWAKACGLAWVVWTVMVTTPQVGKGARSATWAGIGAWAVALGAGYLLWPGLGVDARGLVRGVALVGVPVTAWAWVTVRHATGAYQWVWRGTWWLYDESNVCPRAGQGNANHAATLVVVSLAAACGLAVVESPWWGLLIPWAGWGVWLCRDHRGPWLTQAMGQAGLVVVVAGLWAGWR